MTILNNKLEPIKELDLLEWVHIKLLLMGFSEESIVQVNL